MATPDHTAQFQEPPVNELPEATSTSTSSSDDIDAQFQEPVPTQPSTSTPTNNSSAFHKTTTEKLKDAVKKPFSYSDDSSHTNMLGKKEITSPEMAAANEVLLAKHLKSP